MKFVYIGDYPDGKDEIIAYGVTFRRGEVVEVPAQFERKALGNRFFAPAVEPEPEPDSQASAPHDRNILLTEAAALGITVDGRWGAKRILDAIEAVKGGSV